MLAGTPSCLAMCWAFLFHFSSNCLVCISAFQSSINAVMLFLLVERCCKWLRSHAQRSESENNLHNSASSAKNWQISSMGICQCMATFFLLSSTVTVPLCLLIPKPKPRTSSNETVIHLPSRSEHCHLVIVHKTSTSLLSRNEGSKTSIERFRENGWRHQRIQASGPQATGKGRADFGSRAYQTRSILSLRKRGVHGDSK